MNKPLVLIAVIAMIALGIIAGVKYLASDGTRAKQVADSSEQTPSKVVEQGGNSKATSPAAVPPTNTAKVRPTIERNRVKRGSTERLPAPDAPTTLKTVVTTTGKAEKGDWGIKGMASFVLTSYVDCDVEILEKRETPGGEIKVVEKRTFTKAGQTLNVSEADVVLALYETIQLDNVFNKVKFIGGAMATIGAKLGAPQVAVAGASMTGGAVAADATLKKVDGMSLRDFLDAKEVEVPKGLEEKINKFIEKEVKQTLPFKISDVAGKSYLITYYQDKETGAKSAPLRVDIRHADGNGTKELTDDEWAILRRVNVFLDCQIADKKLEKPGDSIKVDTSAFECLFDPYVEGKYSGEVTIDRTDDMENGDWHLKLRPGSIAIVADNGASNGEVRLQSGEAQIDKDGNIVKSMVVKGKAAAKKLSPHHMLFKARMGGMCSFSAMLTSEPKAK